MVKKGFEYVPRFRLNINRFVYLPLLTGISVLTVLALLTPAFTRDDGFPISTQPMYSQVREQTAEFVTAQGRDSSGATVPLPIEIIAATDDPLIAQTTLNRLSDQDGASRHCTEVAIRANQDDDLTNNLVSIEVVRVARNITTTASSDAGLLLSLIHI